MEDRLEEIETHYRRMMYNCDNGGYEFQCDFCGIDEDFQCKYMYPLKQDFNYFELFSDTDSFILGLFLAQLSAKLDPVRPKHTLATNMIVYSMINEIADICYVSDEMCMEEEYLTIEFNEFLSDDIRKKLEFELGSDS